MVDGGIRQAWTRPLDRRGFLRISAVTAASAAALAACGGGSGGAPPATPSELGRFLPVGSPAAGSGTTLDLGVVLPTSGSGSAYAGEMRAGVELAIAHLAGADALRFTPRYKDNRSGDPQAGVQATRELGLAGVPVMLCSYIADLGAQLPGIAQYKILSIDGAGGTGTIAQKAPYFYGARIVIPDDIYPGTFAWFKAAKPNIRTVAHLTWDLGPSTAALLDSSAAAIRAAGFTPGAMVSSAPTNTDFSAQIAAIERTAPDAILISVLDDVGIAGFLKQYQTSGRPDVTIVSTTNFTPQTYQTVAGSDALRNYHFCYDYFDATSPTSDFGKYFAAEFRKANNNTDPTSLSANFYEDTLILWECVRRVREKNGDPTKGEQLLAAFEEKPEFTSVYGGSGTTAGTISFDRTTHSLSKRGAGIYSQRDGKVVADATFDISGADFTLGTGK